MEQLAAPLVALETGTAIVGPRPLTVNDGVDVTPWSANLGAFRFATASWHIRDDGADCSVGPIAGALGVEVWMLKVNKATVKKWFLFGYLWGLGNAIPIFTAQGGAIGQLTCPGFGSRIAIVGLPTAGRSPTYYLEPIEGSVR